MSKIKLITNAAAFATLAAKYEGAKSEFAKQQDEFIHSYLPSAIFHMLNHGNLHNLNATRLVAVRTHAVSVFGRLVDPFACAPFSKEKGKHLSVAAFAKEQDLTKLQAAKLNEKFKSKRKRLLAIDKETKKPNWLVAFENKLEALKVSNEKNKHKTFDQDLLAIVKRISSMATKEEAEGNEAIAKLAALATELMPSIETKVESQVAELKKAA